MKAQVAFVLLVLGVALIVSDLALPALLPETPPLYIGFVSLAILGRGALLVGLLALTLIYAAPVLRRLPCSGVCRVRS